MPLFLFYSNWLWIALFVKDYFCYSFGVNGYLSSKDIKYYGKNRAILWQ